jgi:hypothetical protein
MYPEGEGTPREGRIPSRKEAKEDLIRMLLLKQCDLPLIVRVAALPPSCANDRQHG